MKLAIALVLAALGWALFQDGNINTTGCAPSFCTQGQWKFLPIGPGGFLVSIDVACDQGLNSCNNSGTTTVVLGTNTYAGWVRAGGNWYQILPGTNNQVIADGRAAPSNTQHLYVFGTDGCIYSYNSPPDPTKQFLRFTVTSFTCSGGQPYSVNHFIAVDPFNENIVYFGGASGLQYSTDGGTTVNLVSTGTIPVSGNNAILVDFDQSDGTGNTLYVHSSGNGLYKCTNAAAAQGTARTCTIQNATGMPTTASHLHVDKQGGVWVTDCHTDCADGFLNSYISGTWTQITSEGSLFQDVAINFNNCSSSATCQLVGVGAGGNLDTRNSGTWTGFNSAKTRCGNVPPAPCDIPWLGWTNENFMSAGGIAFDPALSNTIAFAEGIGVWHATAPSNNTNNIGFVDFSLGTNGTAISELVTYDITSAPGGNVILQSADRPAFVAPNTSAYPATHGCASPQTNAIVYGWSVDWIDANHYVALCITLGGVSESGISSDGGNTWTAFGDNSTPIGGASFNVGGCITASDTQHILWSPGNNPTNIYFSKNGGTNWSALSLSGIPTTGTTGWTGGTFPSANNPQGCAVDRVNGTIYVYNGGNVVCCGGSVHESVWSCTTAVDCTVSANWTKQCGVTAGCGPAGAEMFGPFGNFAPTMRTITGQANTLFISNSARFPNSFYKSTNGGATWVADPTISNVTTWGEGKPCNGADFTIYVVGQIGATGAVWEGDSTSGTITWTNINANQWSNNQVSALYGDMNACGTAYLGWAGMGYTYRTKN